MSFWVGRSEKYHIFDIVNYLINMKAKILYILLFALFSCSKINSKKSYNQIEFFKYQNISLSAIKVDSEEIQDVYFEILLPKELNKTKHTIDGHFSRLFYFERQQIISTLYIPRNEKIDISNSLGLSYDDFQIIVKDNNLNYYFDDVKLNKKRKFGIKKVNNKFYVIYLNVIPEQIEKFNYSINSIKL